MPRHGHAIVVLNLPVPDDRRVWEQAKVLRDAGTPVVVVCPAMRGHQRGRRRIGGIDVRYLPTIEGRGLFGVVAEGIWNSTLCLAVLPWLLRRRVASIQVCNPPDTLFPLLAIGRLLGLRAVYDQHDVVPAMASARPGFGRLRPLFELCERLTVRAANAVLTTSDQQRQRLRDRYGVDPVLVRSAPHAAGSPAVPASPASGRGAVRLGYLGVVGEQEGLEDLVGAVALVRGRGVDVEGVIAGDGPYLETVRRLVRSSGLDDVVTFTGWLQGDALEGFLGGIDAVVVSDPPSEYNHHCAMNKVIEAMARGIPVVMRPLRENLTLTGGAGWVAAGDGVADLAEAIADLAAAPAAERVAVGDRLRARYDAEHRWEQHARRYLEAVSVATTRR